MLGYVYSELSESKEHSNFECLFIFERASERETERARERESTGAWGRGREGGRHKIRSRRYNDGRKPNARLESTNTRP